MSEDNVIQFKPLKPWDGMVAHEMAMTLSMMIACSLAPPMSLAELQREIRRQMREAGYECPDESTFG